MKKVELLSFSVVSVLLEVNFGVFVVYDWFGIFDVCCLKRVSDYGLFWRWVGGLFVYG